MFLQYFFYLFFIFFVNFCLSRQGTDSGVDTYFVYYWNWLPQILDLGSYWRIQVRFSEPVIYFELCFASCDVRLGKLWPWFLFTWGEYMYPLWYSHYIVPELGLDVKLWPWLLFTWVLVMLFASLLIMAAAGAAYMSVEVLYFLTAPFPFVWNLLGYSMIFEAFTL